MVFDIVNIEYFESIIAPECRDRVMKELSEIDECVLDKKEYVAVSYDDYGDALFDYLGNVNGKIMLKFACTAK